MSGQIKSITDFGIFIGLAGNIDGLVHLSDISWDMPGEEAVRSYLACQARAAIAHHWGTFQLTNEAIDAPPYALAAALAEHAIAPQRFRALHPGEVWTLKDET